MSDSDLLVLVPWAVFIAGVAVMLARNDYLNGQTIHVNGGLYFS